MNYTEKAIKDAFLQLLEEKPYNKISVKNIVEICQVNRNTFYYHFQSIPDLLEHIIKEYADDITHRYNNFGTPFDCLLPLMKYCTEHKKSIRNIYRSVQRDIFIKDLGRITLYVVTTYINTVTASLSVSLEDKELLIRLYKCMLVGIMIDWLDNNMEYDLPQAFMRLYYLFPESGKQAFLKSLN